jgi:hypothetical protein
MRSVALSGVVGRVRHEWRPATPASPGPHRPRRTLPVSASGVRQFPPVARQGPRRTAASPGPSRRAAGPDHQPGAAAPPIPQYRSVPSGAARARWHVSGARPEWRSSAPTSSRRRIHERHSASMVARGSTGTASSLGVRLAVLAFGGAVADADTSTDGVVVAVLLACGRSGTGRCPAHRSVPDGGGSTSAARALAVRTALSARSASSRTHAPAHAGSIAGHHGRDTRAEQRCRGRGQDDGTDQATAFLIAAS